MERFAWFAIDYQSNQMMPAFVCRCCSCCGSTCCCCCCCCCGCWWWWWCWRCCFCRSDCFSSCDNNRVVRMNKNNAIQRTKVLHKRFRAKCLWSVCSLRIRTNCPSYGLAVIAIITHAYPCCAFSFWYFLSRSLGRYYYYRAPVRRTIMVLSHFTVGLNGKRSEKKTETKII